MPWMNYKDIEWANFHKEAFALYLKAKKLNKKLSLEEEKIIANFGGLSLEYAKVINQPFPLGEKRIAYDAYHACYYARYILKGRFRRGEKAISKKAIPSYHYSIHVLKRKDIFSRGRKACYKNENTCLTLAHRHGSKNKKVRKIVLNSLLCPRLKESLYQDFRKNHPNYDHDRKRFYDFLDIIYG